MHSSSQEACCEDIVFCDDGFDFLYEFLNVAENNSIRMKTKLMRYLNEHKAPYDFDFNILKLWGKNVLQFPPLFFLIGHLGLIPFNFVMINQVKT